MCSRATLWSLDNSDAYCDYLRGRAALVKYTAEATRTAIASFEGALQRDPGDALARAGLAMASADMYLRFSPADEVERWGERAETEARAAPADRTRYLQAYDAMSGSLAW